MTPETVFPEAVMALRPRFTHSLLVLACACAALAASPFTHGTQTVEVSVTWPGGSTSDREHEEYPEGAISLRASLLSEKPPYRFLSEWFGTEYCQQF